VECGRRAPRGDHYALLVELNRPPDHGPGYMVFLTTVLSNTFPGVAGQPGAEPLQKKQVYLLTFVALRAKS
jgi:hypothetical protein